MCPLPPALVSRDARLSPGILFIVFLHSQSMQTLGYSILNQQVPVQVVEQERDSYLSQISDESLAVLEEYGAEAPTVLYKNYMALRKLVTDPDLLADYVNDFYGPNGPCPVDAPSATQEAIDEIDDLKNQIKVLEEQLASYKEEDKAIERLMEEA